MSSNKKKLNTNCVLCNVLLNDKKWSKKCNKWPNNKKNKNKKPITKHVYENITMIKTERILIKGTSGCRKTFLMLSLLRAKNPEDVHKICKQNSNILLNTITNLLRCYT